VQCKDGKINIISSKARSVLPETELLEPMRNLLASPPLRIYRGLTALLDLCDREVPNRRRSSSHGVFPSTFPFANPIL